MAQPNILKKKAASENKTVDQLVGDALAEYGTIFRAAIALGVTPNSIQHWLKRSGRTTRTITLLAPVSADADKEPA